LNGPFRLYEKQFSKPVNNQLSYEVGMISTDEHNFMIMFLNKEKEAGIEFLVIIKRSSSKNSPAAMDMARTKWMELCNSHQASELVHQLYSPNAYYYNRGRLLQGREAITKEYQYMNSPNYGLTLTPKHIVRVSTEYAFEIGQCSGSYNKPYMLLWQKQPGGSWQVLMDSND
jgi:ketosteroid isomerase-like protein